MRYNSQTRTTACKWDIRDATLTEMPVFFLHISPLLICGYVDIVDSLICDMSGSQFVILPLILQDNSIVPNTCYCIVRLCGWIDTAQDVEENVSGEFLSETSPWVKPATPLIQK